MSIIANLRRNLSQKLMMDGIRADIKAFTPGGTERGRLMRKAAEALWVPHPAYKDPQIIKGFEEMEAVFPLLSRDRVLREGNEYLAKRMLTALDAFRKGDHGEAMAVVLLEFAPQEEQMMRPFVESRGLAESPLGMYQISKMLYTLRETFHHDLYQGLLGQQADLSPKGWLIAHTAVENGAWRDVRDPEQMKIAEDNFREFFIGSETVELCWQRLLSKTQFSFDGEITGNETSTELMDKSCSIRGENLLIPASRHTFAELVEIGKRAEEFRPAVEMIQKIPLEARFGIREALSIEILKKLPDHLLPEAAGQSSLLAAFNAHGDYARSMSLMKASIWHGYEEPNDEDEDISPT